MREDIQIYIIYHKIMYDIWDYAQNMAKGIFVEDVFKSFQYAILKPSPMNFNKKK